MKSRILLILIGIMFIMACSSTGKKSKITSENLAGDTTKVITLDHNSAMSLPAWAKELGLREPKNMRLVEEMSHLTSILNPHEGFNSVTLVYSGNYDTAMNQARRIAKAARLPQNNKYSLLKKQAGRTGHGNRIKGIAYMNYDLSTRDTDFLIYVQVDEKGLLKVSATDMKQMNRQLRKHAGITNRKK